MKNKFLIILLALCTLSGFGQNDPKITLTGTNNQATIYRGAVGSNTAMLLPLGTHDLIYPDLPLKGRIQFNLLTNKLEVHNGTEWVEAGGNGVGSETLQEVFNASNGLDIYATAPGILAIMGKRSILQAGVGMIDINSSNTGLEGDVGIQGTTVEIQSSNTGDRIILNDHFNGNGVTLLSYSPNFSGSTKFTTKGSNNSNIVYNLPKSETSGTFTLVKSVNGKVADENGNVTIAEGGSTPAPPPTLGTVLGNSGNASIISPDQYTKQMYIGYTNGGLPNGVFNNGNLGVHSSGFTTGATYSNANLNILRQANTGATATTDGVKAYMQTNSEIGGRTQKIVLGSDFPLGIEIEDSQDKVGFQGYEYYGANATENTYVQKKYVDDAIATGLGSIPTIYQVLGKGYTAFDQKITFEKPIQNEGIGTAVLDATGFVTTKLGMRGSFNHNVYLSNQSQDRFEASANRISSYVGGDIKWEIYSDGFNHYTNSLQTLYNGKYLRLWQNSGKILTLNYPEFTETSTKTFPISFNGIEADVDGKVILLPADIGAPSIQYIAPASSTASGTKGEIRVTSMYVYYCIEANRWVRTPTESNW